MKRFKILSAVLLGLVFSAPVYAHKVNVFAYVESREVLIEGYFVDGKKARNSTVQVFDAASGKLIEEGQTDDEGRYRMATPDADGLKIVVNAGMGHRGTFSIDAADLSGAAATAATQGHVDHSHDHETDNVGHEPVSTQGDFAVAPQAMEGMIHDAVNEAIKPLVRQLSESQEKASLSSIVGGIGYIIGMLGLWAFFKARQIAAGKS